MHTNKKVNNPHPRVHRHKKPHATQRDNPERNYTTTNIDKNFDPNVNLSTITNVKFPLIVNGSNLMPKSISKPIPKLMHQVANKINCNCSCHTSRSKCNASKCNMNKCNNNSCKCNKCNNSSCNVSKCNNAKDNYNKLNLKTIPCSNGCPQYCKPCLCPHPHPCPRPCPPKAATIPVVLIGEQIDVISENYIGINFFPWVANGMTSAILIFEAVIVGAPMSIKIIDVTHGVILGELTNVAASAFYEMPFALPISNARLSIQVKKNTSNFDPQIFGISMKNST